MQCVQTLTGHTGSVLCLQYDNQIIASGSSDAIVRYVFDRTKPGSFSAPRNTKERSPKRKGDLFKFYNLLQIFPFLPVRNPQPSNKIFFAYEPGKMGEIKLTKTIMKAFLCLQYLGCQNRFATEYSDPSL